MSILIEELPSGHRLVEGRFDDIDAMATSPLAWDQEYEQIGRGHFRGHFTQFLMDRLQLCRVRRAYWHLGFRPPACSGGFFARSPKAGSFWRAPGRDVTR
jgi:hypothetical protein